MSAAARPLGRIGILRLGAVQAALGAIVVLATVTMNRVMVVELRLPAVLPAILVALHYGVQVMRPAMGHGSDQGGRRTPWIVGGMTLLATGALAAAGSIALLAGPHRVAGLALAVAAYGAIGLGVGTSGTSLLALLGQRVEAGQRAAAASTVWIMMIAGIAVTAGLAGHLLQPYSPHRLMTVTGSVAAAALLVTVLATAGIERAGNRPDRAAMLPPVPLRTALRQVWQDPQARRFTGFVALSMLAYSAEEILLEPFAGIVFHMTPAQTAQLTGLQHGGALLGMLLVAAAGSRRAAGMRLPSLRGWTIGGCVASALSLAALAVAGLALAGTPGNARMLGAVVLSLGLGNGLFAVAAVGSMMQLASGAGGRGGIRIGLWGAAQALAFALGGLGAATATDAARAMLHGAASAYAVVLLAEMLLFLIAARQAARVFPASSGAARIATSPCGVTA